VLEQPIVIVRNNIMNGSSCNFGGSGDTYPTTSSPVEAPGEEREDVPGELRRPDSSVTSAGDFTCGADTCAKGAADQTPGSYPAVDIDGKRRPQGERSCGADELDRDDDPPAWWLPGVWSAAPLAQVSAAARWKSPALVTLEVGPTKLGLHIFAFSAGASTGETLLVIRVAAAAEVAARPVHDVVRTITIGCSSTHRAGLLR